MTATATTRTRQRQHESEQRRALVEQLRRRRRSRRIVLAAGGVVIAVVTTFVVIGATTSPGSRTAPPDAVSRSVLADLIGVPAATLTAVGSGTSTNPPRAVEGSSPAAGKPHVLYLGAEYCPFCAGQRWPLIQALSRFGHFSGLRTVRSASNDLHPNTATFTFHDVTYTSSYVTFTARELYSNVRQGSGYRPLDTATAAESALLSNYGGRFPLLDLGGRYVQVGASYDIGLLNGLEWDQIAGALADPHSEIARGIDGSANILTADLCSLTDGQPTRVCTAPAVQSIHAR